MYQKLKHRGYKREKELDYLNYNIDLNSRKKCRILLYLMLWVPLVVILLLISVDIYFNSIL